MLNAQINIFYVKSATAEYWTFDFFVYNLDLYTTLLWIDRAHGGWQEVNIQLKSTDWNN